MLKETDLHSDRIRKFADSIADYFAEDLLNYDYESYDDFAIELDNAIKNGNVINIPELDKEDSFQMALDIIMKDSGSDYNDSMDGDFDSGMKSAGLGTDEDYGYYGPDENVINDTNQIIKMLSDSIAAKKAKKMGLVHVGFGNYAEKPGEKAMYKTVNGKLRKVGGAQITPKKSAEEEEPVKKKEDEKKKDKKVRRGITNVRRVSGGKFTYEFDKDGRHYKFTLTKDERKQIAGKGSLMSIIKSRLEKKAQRQRAKLLKKGKKVFVPNTSNI